MDIAKAFSKAAGTYDQAADFQRDAGRKLIDLLVSDSGPKEMVLDVGMGTGTTTRELAQALGQRIFGCDIAWGMVHFAAARADDLAIVQADLEKLPFGDGSFDLVFSNIAYHWAVDLKDAFAQAQRVLKPGGRLYVSLMGRGSLCELYASVAAATDIPAKTDLFPSIERVREYLQEAGFEIPELTEVRMRSSYASSLDLVKALKRIGANKLPGAPVFGVGQKKLFFGMIDEYDRRFTEDGMVYATYNVVMGCARK